MALLAALPLAALRLVAQQAVVPVPAAEGLQLKGDFTLVYAVTETNQAPTAILLREYQQLRQDYQRELQKDPYVQPVPDDFYLPFAAYQKRRTQPHHLTITVSSRDGSLFYQTMDADYTYARLYDGHQTQTFGDGHSGSTSAGLHIGELTDCVLPAVGSALCSSPQEYDARWLLRNQPDLERRHSKCRSGGEREPAILHKRHRTRGQ